MGPIGSIPTRNALIPVRQDAVQLGGLVGMLFIPTTWSSGLVIKDLAKLAIIHKKI
jgi:hypothetical protein